MKRYYIISEKFKGQAELIYHKGRLVGLSLIEAEMEAALVEKFLRSVRANEQEIYQGFSGSTKILPADVELSFDMFWQRYAKKINRIRAQKIWDIMSKTDQASAYEGIVAYDKFLKTQKWRTKSDPENYLRNKMWENEY